jgi:hypothetical protein
MNHRTIRILGWDFGPTHTSCCDVTFEREGIFKTDQLHLWELMKFGSGDDPSSKLLPIVSAGLKVLFPHLNPEWSKIGLEQQMGINESSLDISTHTRSYFYLLDHNAMTNNAPDIVFVDGTAKNKIVQTHFKTGLIKPVRIAGEDNSKWQARLKLYNKANSVAAMELVLAQQVRDKKRFVDNWKQLPLDFSHILSGVAGSTAEDYRMNPTTWQQQQQKKLKLDDKSDAYFMCAAMAMSYFMKTPSLQQQLALVHHPLTPKAEQEKKKPKKKRKKAFQPADIPILR